MRDETDPELEDEIFAFEYRERFHLSVEQFDNEPWEAIWQAKTIWALRKERDNLEDRRRQPFPNN